MAYVGYEQVAATDTAKTVAALTIPANATHVELQADTNPVRYVMDGSTAATTAAGMVLAVAHVPKLFLVGDLRNISFTRSGGSNGNLNLHYYSGRDV